ncbi:MAG: hypothetical protein Q3988_06915 [Gemella sp.]|nr:hypothetical protein [Gemella sp.]
MNYKIKLKKWLQQQDEINAKLLSMLLGAQDIELNLNKDNIDEIQPEILSEINYYSNDIIQLKQLLKEELNNSKTEDYGFRLLYLKYRMGLLEVDETSIILKEVEKEISYESLTKNIDIDKLYSFLFYVNNINTEIEGNIILKKLRDLILVYTTYFSRKFYMPELAICIQISIFLKKYFGKDYFMMYKNFLLEYQSDSGYFYHGNPFFRAKDIDMKLMHSFYALVTLNKLEEISK